MAMARCIVSERVRIFRAQIDVAAGGAHRESGDGHALDQHERIAFHDHAVGVGAAIAFVRVADDVFLVGWQSSEPSAT